MVGRPVAASGAVPSSRIRVFVVALLVLAVGVVASAVPAQAVISRSDLPSKATVKSVLNGTGRWFAGTYGDTRALGSRPSACRSDLQMRNFREDRGRVYSGRQVGLPGVGASASVDVFRYATVRAAKRAVARNGSYPQRCPRVVEWVCTQCDGVWTTWRSRVAVPRVGQQRVAWRYREAGNARSAGFTVVARKGTTVVRVSVGRDRYPGEGAFTYPKPIPKKKVVKVARIALRTAT